MGGNSRKEKLTWLMYLSNDKNPLLESDLSIIEKKVAGYISAENFDPHPRYGKSGRDIPQGDR